MSKVGERSLSAKERSLDKACMGFMQSICQKYDNVAEVDKIAAVARKVDTVKIVMQENVDAALQNCVKLESIELAAGKCILKLSRNVLTYTSVLLFEYIAKFFFLVPKAVMKWYLTQKILQNWYPK